MKRNLRIVFMGTPEFAVASLKAILENNYNVVAVVTAPDRPAGRGRKLNQSAVKQFALKNDLNILQPGNLKDTDFQNELKKLKVNLMVVVAFRMLPKEVWQIPQYGTFNLHASLLPQYRGAAPINWAIINGEKETGVSTFYIDEKIDTGKIILQESVLIHQNENAGQLHDRLMEAGAKLVVKSIQLIENDSVKETEQKTLLSENEKPKPAPKIFREDLKINWDQDVERIHDFIRGMSPYPAAYTTLISPEGKSYKVKILEGQIINGNPLKSKNIQTDNKTFLRIACKNGYIEINKLQMAGKKALKKEDFLRGFNISENWKIS